MLKNPFITRRDNIVYFRIAIPSNLRPFFNKNELCQSLDTESSKHAIPAALKLAGDAKTLFINIETAMSESNNGGYMDKIIQIIAESPFNKTIKKPLSGLQLLMHNQKQKIKRDDENEALRNHADEINAIHKREKEELANKIKAEAFDKGHTSKPAIPREPRKPKAEAEIVKK